MSYGAARSTDGVVAGGVCAQAVAMARATNAKTERWCMKPPVCGKREAGCGAGRLSFRAQRGISAGRVRSRCARNDIASRFPHPASRTLPRILLSLEQIRTLLQPRPLRIGDG